MNPTDTDSSFSAERHYFSQLAQGRFAIPQCGACARLHFFPRVVCPHCGSDDLQWVEPGGQGEVYSTTIVRQKAGDYTVCLINLAEGPRLMSRVVDVPPEDVHIGMQVKARIDTIDDQPLLVFTPYQEGQA
ncbi:MAG: Zn-ribbon domain-containing OB-fold protein [Alcaligenaceae bacterium]|nr:Zn-ribbon domain-containing OB-fold protein [Alcaligenaceae bacterium]